MDELDVVGQIADKRKLPQREGTIVSIHPTHVLVQPKGSTRLIPCDFDGSLVVDVGQWCTFLRTGKRYVISAVMNRPRTLSLSTQPSAKAAVADSQLHGNVGGEIVRIRRKTTPVSADTLMINDSEDSNRPKSVQVGDLPTGAGGSNNLYVETVGVFVNNTTTPTSLFDTGIGSLSIPANWFVAGRGIEIFMGGIVSGIVSGAGNLVFSAGVASDLFANPGSYSIDGLLDAIWQINVKIVCLTDGVSGTLAWYMNSTLDGTPSEGLDAVSFDTTAAYVFDVQATFSVADSGNSVQNLWPGFIREISAA